MMFSLKSFNDRNLTVDLGETQMLLRKVSDFSAEYRTRGGSDVVLPLT
jgi:hypothetical protein